MRRIMVAAAVALALPASASAASQWYYNRQPIPEGKVLVVPATTAGRGYIALKPPGTRSIKIPCAITGTEAFWNTPLGGMDETRSIGFVCEGATATATLPWASTLIESELPLHDAWEHVSISLTFNGVRYGTFTGSLDTTVGDVDPLFERERDGTRDEPDSYLTFRSNRTRFLAGANGYELWLTGGYHFGGKGERITDEPGLF